MSHLEIEELDLTPPANRDDLDDWLIRNFGILREMLIRGYFKDGLVLGKEPGIGIRVNSDIPATYPWHDMLGVVKEGSGAARPSVVTYVGSIEQLQFGVGDEIFNEFHVVHDLVPLSDLFVHVHWSHTVTNVTGGTVSFNLEHSYSKGHNQDAFSAAKNIVLVGEGSAIQRQHIISEIPLSVAGGSATELDSNEIEPDGVILLRTELVANNLTVSGGLVPDIFIHYVDIHYQSTNIGTKQRAPNFYV